MRKELRGVKRMRSYLGAASLLAFVSFEPVTGAQEPRAASESDLAETARRLSNPLSDVWALFARFDLDFADGEVNLGDPKIGSKMIFQPNPAGASLRRRGEQVEPYRSDPPSRFSSLRRFRRVSGRRRYHRFFYGNGAAKIISF